LGVYRGGSKLEEHVARIDAAVAELRNKVK
jgi:hypothetical protein